MGTIPTNEVLAKEVGASYQIFFHSKRTLKMNKTRTHAHTKKKKRQGKRENFISIEFVVRLGIRGIPAELASFWNLL